MADAILDKLSLLLRRYGKAQALLFTGAGFSVGATNIQGDPVPVGSQLITLLKDKIGEDVDDISILSRLFGDQFGQHKLFELLTTSFRARSIAAEHEAILSFPWKSVYTTNYDDVGELAAKGAKVNCQSYSHNQHPRDIDTKSLPIIHLNGYINDVTFRDFKAKIRLTNTSYLSDEISKSPWGQKFRSDILTSPCIIFIGYSMYDLDIGRVIYEFPEMRDRIYFVTTPSPSRALSVRLNDFGTIVPIGTERFAGFLSGVLGAGIERRELYFASITRLPKYTTPPKLPTDANLRELLVWGDVDQELLSSEVTTGSARYVIERDCVETIANLIQRSQKCNIVLRSNIGNGKSLCTEILAHKMNNLHAEVFKIENRTKKLLEELPQVAQLSGKKVFIIDNLGSHIDTVRAIQSLNLPDYAVICCVRTSLYDLLSYEMDKLFGEDLFEFDLDTISPAERSRLTALFDTYGYWRELQKNSDAQKDLFITRECSSELRAVLLHFLDCQPIKGKIKAIFSDDGSVDDGITKIRSLIILAQMINLAGLEPRLDLLDEILEFDAYALAHKARAEHREFLKVKHGSIALRSTILSDYIVKNIIDGAYLIDAMIEVVTRLDEIYHNDPVFDELMKIFVRYSFLEGYLPTRNKRDLLIKFFENVKVLNRFRTEPLFWLQYAIARLSLKEFEEAKLLFDAAYSFSKARGYLENRHLDNQFARYLLESRTSADRYHDYMDAFNQAHQILVRQMAAESNSYNPYRVASNYFEFAVRRRDELSSGDRVRVQRACAEVLKRINIGSDRLSRYPAVRQCEYRMRQTVKVLQ
jgi:hypothetical protein